jgi:energy-coupling factor transport system permease protein
MLIVPLVTTALSDAHERADVLNARGFRALPYRTTLNAPKDSGAEKQFRRALYVLSALQIGYALWR